jgi:hypothetical protein
MLRREALVRTNVSEKRIASIIRVDRIRELGNLMLVTANIVPSSQILFTLMMETCSSETSVLTRVIRRNMPENGIHEHTQHLVSTVNRHRAQPGGRDGHWFGPQVSSINKTNSVAFNSQANYTDRTAVARREVSASFCG